MQSPLIFGIIVGLIVGVSFGVLIRLVGPIDKLIPDSLNTLLTGAVAGGIAAFAYSYKKGKVKK